nr:hypothetical protein [Burkholderia cenocepacia]
MSENTKIEWCDHVLIQPGHTPMVGVSEPMTRAAEGNAIADVEAQLGIFRPFLAMVSFKIPTFVVAAVGTPEAFGREAIVSRAVTIKKRAVFPLLARRASLFLLAFRDERGQIHASFLGGNFQSPFRSLSHG